MVDPHDLLSKVHPDLVKVINAASQTPIAFEVIQGLRTPAAEATAVATGHSETMHSRHLADPHFNGLACAVDVAAIVDDHITWTPISLYENIAAQVKYAASVLGIPIEWGGDWATFKDWGHFQLPWKDYP